MINCWKFKVTFKKELTIFINLYKNSKVYKRFFLES